MPNTTVRAAAEGMPAINRRKMLLGLAAASTAVAAVTSATPVPVAVHDPLLDAIKAYRDGVVAFNATGNDLSDDEHDALFDVHIAKPQTVLDEWSIPALTQAGAVEALRVAQEEADLYENSPMIAAMARAALGFLQANTVTVAMPAAAPERSTLVDLIAAHKVAYAAFCAAINPADEEWCRQNGAKCTKAAKLRWERTNRTEHRATMAICQFHAATPAEGRMKANYLLKFDGSRHGYSEFSEEQQRAILLSLKGGVA